MNAANPPASRPEIVHEPVSSSAFGIVEKPLSAWERIGNVGALRKCALLVVLAVILAPSVPRGRLSISAFTCPGCGDSSRIRLPILIASGIEWVTKSTVKRVPSHSASSSSCILRRVSASSAANGSSISRMAGSMAMPRAIATRCFMPPESVCGKLSANAARLTLAMYSSAFSSAALRGRRPLACSGNITFSLTVRQGSSWSNSWNTIIRSGPGRVTASPFSRISPSTGFR